MQVLESKNFLHFMARKHHKVEKIKPVRSRAEYDCNQKLSELIRLANFLPPDFNLKDVLNDRREKDLNVFLESFSVFIYRIFRDLPKETQHYIFESPEYQEYEKMDSFEYWINLPDLANEKLNEMLDEQEISQELFEQITDARDVDIAEFLVNAGYWGNGYSWLDSLKDENGFSFSLERERSDSYYEAMKSEKQNAFLRAIIRLQNIKGLIGIFQQFDSAQKSKRNVTNPFSKNSNKPSIPEEVQKQLLTTTLSFDEKGRATFALSEFAEAVQGADVSRIRVCGVCKNFFWASRSDAKACSKQHAKTLQMRRLRELWKEKGHTEKGGYLHNRSQKNKKA
jgi:hypothetical protein